MRIKHVNRTHTERMSTKQGQGAYTKGMHTAHEHMHMHSDNTHTRTLNIYTGRMHTAHAHIHMRMT